MGAAALVLSRDGAPEEATVLRMLRAAPHRGSDRSVEILGRAAVGVCNDPRWVTATIARSARRLAVFCGALDNHEEVRAALGRDGSPPSPDAAPAALLLAGFERWGTDAVSRLRGSFSGAVTDGREVHCFRDHFGTRPFFHHDGSSGFFAATEVKQVLAGAGIPREPDLEHLEEVLFGGVELSSAYRGVERLPARVVATAGSRPGLASQAYWDPASAVETRRIGAADALEGTLHALERAVGRMLTGHDAVLLSGGLDSPALAAFAARVNGRSRPVQAVTAIYPDHPSSDERTWTRMAADHLGMPLHEYVAEAGSLDDIAEWVALVDGPVRVLSIPESAEAYRAARAVGARTVMTGEIAEMLFESRRFLLDHLVSHGRLRPAVRALAARRRAGRSRRALARDVVRALVPPSLVPSRFRRSAPPQLRGLPAWVDPQRLVSAAASPLVWRVGPRRRWIEVQTSAFIGPSAGFEADEICAAACGVESRRPFTDVDLWEFVLSLPAEVKFPDGSTKPLLRRAMRGLLPDELLDRKDKTYFDEFHLATADYDILRRFLVDPRHRLDGFDYVNLQERLKAEDMPIYELQWARNLARVHAFLEQW